MNLRLLFVVILIGAQSLFLNAQDTIVFKSGDRTIAIVKEISDLEVVYKDFSFPDGPDYRVRKSSLSRISFFNGQNKQFAKEKSITVYGRNIFAYHIFDMVYQDFSISYEHILPNGRIGFKIPVAIGYNNSNNNSGPRDYKNIYYSGLALNVYLMGQRMASYFIGPEIHIGSGQQSYSYYDDLTGSHYYQDERFTYGSFLINNGISFCPVPEFRLAAVLGIGLRYYELDHDQYDEDGMKSTAYFTFSMGYRF